MTTPSNDKENYGSYDNVDYGGGGPSLISTSTTTTASNPTISNNALCSPPPTGTCNSVNFLSPRTPVTIIHNTTTTTNSDSHYYHQPYQTLQNKTPIGSSKVLRKHFQRLALTSPTTATTTPTTTTTTTTTAKDSFLPLATTNTPRRKIKPGTKTPATTTAPATAGKIASNHRLRSTKNNRRLIESGPVRILTPTNHNKTNTTHISKRIGYDGTFYTPSKQLLRSTVSSRSQNYQPQQQQHYYASNTECCSNDHTNNNSTQTMPPPSQILSPKTMDHEKDMTPTSANTSMDDSIIMSYNDCYHAQQAHPHHPQEVPLTPKYRKACLDPVAMTLLNDGKENLYYLLQKDAIAENDNHEHPKDTTSTTIFPSLIAQRTTSPLFDDMETKNLVNFDDTPDDYYYDNHDTVLPHPRAAENNDHDDDDDDDDDSSKNKKRKISSPTKVSSQLLSYTATNHIARPIARVASIKAREMIDLQTSKKCIKS